jgi:lysozyme
MVWINERKLTALLTLHEGNERFPYECTAGKLTIGVGFNLEDVGLYPEEIDFILKRRLGLLYTQLRSELSFFRHLSAVRQMVLIDMAYNLGVSGLLGFGNTMAALHLRDYKLAAKEMLDSKWARIDVGYRAVRLANMMRTDEWPSDLPLNE